MKKTELSQTEIEKVAIKFPDRFDIMPDCIVDMPNGRKAHIYSTTDRREEVDPAGRRFVTVDAWRVIVVNRDGQKARFPNHAYCRNDEKFTDPLSVKLYIEDVAAAFAKVQRRSSSTTEFDDE